MSNTLQTRLRYMGGNAEGRLQEGKLRTLKKAMLYSYQAETITLEDGRQFRCLINPDKLKPDYDNKIISIPFSDVQLNSSSINKGKNEVKIGLKCGDVFHWDRTNTDWIVYLRNLEEDSYFRGEIRRCKYEIVAGDTRIKAYVRGPVETTIQWFQKGGVEYNEPNYTLNVMVPATEENLEFFHRFTKVKVNEKTWEVEAVDSYSIDGIIEMTLKEFFNNQFEEEESEDIPEIIEPDNGEPRIEGKDFVNPYDTGLVYNILNAENGEWSISNSKAKIVKVDSNSVTLEITTGRSGQFHLIYKVEDKEPVVKVITVESL